MTSLQASAHARFRPFTGTPPVADFSLGPGEPAGLGLHRILLEQVDLGSWHAERARQSDEHVHEVRKTTKRLRAVLRMVRDDIDATDYTRLNVDVRDLARELSQIRSAAVQVDLLESLVAADGQLGPATRGLHTGLVTAADKQREDLAESVVQGLLSRLAGVRSDLECIQFPSEEEITLCGIRKTYRRGRRSMTRAYAEPTIESFHIWRKQVKYLRHQMEILEWGGAPAISLLVSDLEELGEGLGMDHDLADLERAARNAGPGTLSPSGRGHLDQVISTRRAGLAIRLKPIGARVYAAKSSAFAEQMIPRPA